MPLIHRRVVVIQRIFAAPRLPPAGESLWDRTPKFLLCLLAVLFAAIGKIVAEALHGGIALQYVLAVIGGVLGFYLIKLLPWLGRAVLIVGGLAAVVAFAVWLERLLVH